MMDFVKFYAEKIAIFVITSAYIELILPNNSFRKYIRFIIGAILISIILEPLFFIIKRW